MDNINKTSWFKRFFGSKLFLITALVILFLITLGYARAYYQDYKIRQEIKQLEHEVDRLQTKKIESLEILQYVTSDDFVEEKARTELNLRKPGEKMVVIERENDSDGQEIQSTEEVKPLNNPTKWWYYFWGK